MMRCDDDIANGDNGVDGDGDDVENFGACGIHQSWMNLMGLSWYRNGDDIFDLGIGSATFGFYLHGYADNDGYDGHDGHDGQYPNRNHVFR